MQRTTLIGVAAALALGAGAGAQPQVCGLETFDAISPDYWLGVESAVGERIERTFHVPTFIDILRSQRWDCVMIAYYYPVESGDRAPLLGELRKHLDAGGTMAVTYPHLDEWPELQTLLGVASAVDPAAPEDVAATSPVHPVWLETGRVDIAPPATWPDFGDVITPVAGARAIGEFERSGAPAVIESHNGRVLVFGVDWDDWGPAVQMGRDTTYYLTGCLPDFDDSGALDLFDFLAYQNTFAAGDMRADLDKNRRLDIFDFLIFQTAFALGCRPE